MSTFSKIKIVIIGLLLVITIALIFSDKIMPNSVEFYTIKRFQEKVFMLLQSDTRNKISFNESLLETRFNELSSIVYNKEYDYLYSSSLRYSTTAGVLTQMIKSGEFKDLENQTRTKFKEYQQEIQNLYNSCLSQDDDRCKYVQDAYNYLAIYLDQLSN